MNHLELLAWGLCNGWSIQRGTRFGILTDPNGDRWDIEINALGVPIVDHYVAARIKGGMEYPGPTEEEIKIARLGLCKDDRLVALE